MGMDGWPLERYKKKRSGGSRSPSFSFHQVRIQKVQDDLVDFLRGRYRRIPIRTCQPVSPVLDYYQPGRNPTALNLASNVTA